MTDDGNGAATKGSASDNPVVAQFESSPNSTPAYETARWLAGQGLRVFPVAARGKKPLIEGWPEKATTDPSTLAAWHQRYPDANWGVTDVLVVDVDIKGDGFKSLKEWGGLESAWEVTTGTGGRHYLFQLPEGMRNRVGWLPGVDIRALGGQVVVAGSVHPLGARYEWAGGSAPTEPLPEPPANLVESLRGASASGSGQIDTEGVLAGLPDGERDDALFRAASSWRRRGFSRAEVTANVLYAAANCNPPFPYAEAIKCVDSAFKQDHDDLAPWMVDWAAWAVQTFDPFAQQVAVEAGRIRVRDEARRIVAVEKAGREYPSPELNQDGLLSDLVKVERVHEQPRINGLMGMAHNVVIAASYKSGKTTMGGNVLKAAADGVPFLGRDVHMGGGRIAWLNGEMDRDDFLDYLGPHGITNTDRIVVRNMRGRRMSLLNDFVADEFVKWLIDNEVEWLWADSWRVLCAWNQINENRNEEVELLTARIDLIKREAGVSTFTALAHTGRAQQDEGAEHARGATALDDWQDVRWVLTRSGADRFLKVEGRGKGVGLDETLLVFDPETRLLSLGVGNRSEARSSRGVGQVAEFVMANPGCTSGDIRSHLGHSGITHSGDQSRAMESAVRAGLVHWSKHGVKHVYVPGADPARQWATAASLTFEGEQQA
jgi:hypothetical protein